MSSASPQPREAAPAAVPVGIRPERRYFPELESLRGVAILMVYAFHCDGILHTAPRPGSEPGTWVPLLLAPMFAGHTGVDLFFVLSAFLLALPFIAAGDGGRPVAGGRYARRRALRILPLYWAVVAVAAVLLAVIGRSARPLLDGLAYLLFLNSGLDLGLGLWPVSIPLWSLATEVQFYVLLPLLGLGARTRAGRYAGAAVALGLVALWAALGLGWLHGGSVNALLKLRASVIGRLPMFAAGIAAAWVFHHHGAALRARLAAMPLLNRGGGDLVLLACALMQAGLLQWTIHHGFAAVDALPWVRVVEAAGWAAIVLVVLIVPLRARTLVVNPVLDWLGRLSYSIYLLHVPLLVLAIVLLRARFPEAFAMWTVPSAAAIVLVSGIVVALAACTYRFVERPFLVRKEHA